ncbi:hypothetical protein D9613_002692 [Agrocybe pediades]|uniref:J domain-containing protein n=1 Tax=Agrocybe pediades TaxID=84607 RepID=A0A8H4QQP8_9AGAR|nr:hypothetical protein D9613_002692 [Agrocybe pediades]
MRVSAEVATAFSTLGLDQGASLDVVKTTYKQIALQTHPDKNPGNPDATVQFQRVSEAYTVLVKHFASPKDASVPRFTSPFFDFGDDESDGFEYFDEGDYSDSDDEYFGFYPGGIDLEFYLRLFQHMHGGGRQSYNQRTHWRPQYQSPKEYHEQLRRNREEQIAAQERRKKEAADRKERLAKLREQDRLDAEERQKRKAEEKKAQAEAERKSAEERAKEILRKAQETRTSVFAAAREGDAEKVKQGIWEVNVDAAGGEVRSGCEPYVKDFPSDASETLLHIAAQKGDADLVQWLDSHGADPEERNSQGLTALHIALRQGNLTIVEHFIETYPPNDRDYKAVYECPSSDSLLSFALESREPELVWMILDKKLASPSDMNQAWTWATSEEGSAALNGSSPTAAQLEKSQDILKLLMRYGGFSPKGPTKVPASNTKQAPSKQAQGSAPRVPPQDKGDQWQRYHNPRGRGRGRASHNTPPAH